VTLTLFDEFCGFGGSSQGAHAVPGVEVIAAANHSRLALDVHGRNFPSAIHLGGDVAARRAKTFPRADVFWASPACPPWSNARGKRRDFDKSTVDQGTLWAEEETDAERRARLELAQRRALMEEVPKYLRRMSLRGRPVLAGVVENVVEARLWAEWDRWIREIQTADPAGYRTRVIALNSMHAAGPRTGQAPQSRDRLYVAYWHRSLGRDPDWDRWLRPAAWCPRCDQRVAAVQSWKTPGADMGRYRSQYVYRCPHTACRGGVVEPEFLPAAAAIDWTLPGERIGDRRKPLAEKTRARIAAGLAKYARPAVRPIIVTAAGHTFERRPGVRTRPVEAVLPTQHTTAAEALAVPMLVPAGGTWRDDAHPLTTAMGARTTRETDAVLVPPLLVPAEGRDGKVAAAVGGALRTQTARNETGILVPPFIAELRGGGSEHRALTDALATVTASGNHHGLVLAPGASTTSPAQTMAEWAALYAYDSGALRDHHREPLPTQTTVEGDAVLAGLAGLSGLPDVDDCLFRMLEPHEIARGMAFTTGYRVHGTKRQRVQGYGNAVTPPAAEVLLCALAECITSEAIRDHDLDHPLGHTHTTAARPLTHQGAAA
jgi:DNA (cytosine-5)-methyltransferase 1